jgi:multicomponent Na+:H+ antiporter subunit A
VADFVREKAPEIAKGKNLVNVVLTDVRSLDTLMETLVVVLGALGVVALLTGHERFRPSSPASRGHGSRAVEALPDSGLLPGLARMILPIGAVFSLIMLWKGHNSPGGGFVAGLSLGVTAMIAVAAMGPRRFARRVKVSLSAVAIFGGLLMLASGALGWLVGKPYLTQLHGSLAWGPLRLPLHTTLLFDLGVMLAVSGAIAVVGLAFWTTAMASDQEKSP